jgi:dipeptidyl-peptidase 4
MNAAVHAVAPTFRSVRAVILAAAGIVALAGIGTRPLVAQELAIQGPGVTMAAEVYERAERFLNWNVRALVAGDEVRPQWLEGDRFWYRNRVHGGHEVVLVDPARGTRQVVADYDRLAASLAAAADTVLSAHQLRARRVDLALDAGAVLVGVSGRSWRCELVGYRCVVADRPATPPDAILSPDGRRAAYIRDHDLWVRELATGEDVRLTTDGAPHHGYAADHQGWRQTRTPVLLWSPDSRRIATYRLDERGVRDAHLLRMAEPLPELQTWKYAVPGDTVVPMLERVVIHVDERRVVRLDTPPDHQRASNCCGLLRDDEWRDVQWSADGRRLAFVSTARDYRTVALRIADPATGAVRTVLEESDPAFFQGTAAAEGPPSWRVLFGRGEVLWGSQRDGWAHLYLYDLATGRLKHRVTSGAWGVLHVLHVDEAARRVVFTAVGREPGRDLYHRHLYHVGLDGRGLTLLTPEDADHDVAVSPSGRFFVDSYSRTDVPPVTVLRRVDGGRVAGAAAVAGGAGRAGTARELERADISRLTAAGWRPPERFTARARDGTTLIYGLLYRPMDFDPTRRYPIVNVIYPGPQRGSIGGHGFMVEPRGHAQALAELGFVVVLIDGLGTPMRSRDFHTAYYADLGDNGLPDQIAAMRQLAERYPWIDLGRVGITGHSGGGFATAAALLRHPDFFHVGVASAGNHDNRGYTFYWGEKWHGPLVRGGDERDAAAGRAPVADNYARQANHLLAANLRGRLLLSYGTMDANVHPNTTLLLIDALIAANKDFDVAVLPNRGHGFSGEPWWVRQSWNYFVRHLLGAEPPPDHRIRPARPTAR